VALSFQQFLAQAQNLTIPNQTNTQSVTEMADLLFPTFDMTEQACQMEWANSSVTLVGADQPEFVLPEVPFDEVHEYKFLGVRNVGTPAVTVWHVDVGYPGIGVSMREDFQFNTTDNFNILSIQTPANNRATVNGKSLFVYPRGKLSLCQEGPGTIGDVYTLTILRKVCGGVRSRLVNGLIDAGIK